MPPLMPSGITLTNLNYFNMKTYKIKLLTPAGVVTVNYTDNQDLTQFEQELKVKYNSFVTLSSNEIVTSGTTN